MDNFLKSKPISSLSERIKKTPKNNPQRGYWSNQRGMSIYIPVTTQKNIIILLEQFKLTGISYIDAMPDFRQCSYCTVYLQSMFIARYKNFSECDKLCAIHWNSTHYLNYSSWTSQKVKNYRFENSLCWHERNDRITCDLVPSKINSFFLHLGGIAECKRINNLSTYIQIS